MGQAAAQVPLPLLGAVARDGLGMAGPVRLPVAGVVGAPLGGAVAADLAILGIAYQLLSAVLAAALLLARPVRAGGLLRVKARWQEQLMANTATPMAHPSRVRDGNCPGARLPKNRQLEENIISSGVSTCARNSQRLAGQLHNFA
jgi:hypothetical protein